MRTLSCIVRFQTGFKILGETSVETLRVNIRLQDIDMVEFHFGFNLIGRAEP